MVFEPIKRIFTERDLANVFDTGMEHRSDMEKAYASFIPALIFTSSTAQRGGGSFNDRGELLRFIHGRTN